MSLLPERIRHVVLLSAVVPEDGTRVLDQIDADVRTSVEAGIAGGVYTVGVDAARFMLCNDADEEQSDFILRRVVDDAAALLTETVDLSGYRLSIPRTYVQLSQDQCYPPDFQAKSAQRTLAEVTTLDAGHMADRPELGPASSSDAISAAGQLARCSAGGRAHRTALVTPWPASRTAVCSKTGRNGNRNGRRVHTGNDAIAAAPTAA